MKGTSVLRHCFVSVMLAVSLAQTGFGASPTRPTTRIHSTADASLPQKDFPARIRRFLIWLYDELSIPRP